MRTILVALVSAMLCAPSVAEAQAVRRPSRPYRGLFGGGPPPDPNRTRQELTLTASFLAGYDDALTPGATQGPTQPGQNTVSGYTGTADLNLRYYVGRAAKSFSLDSRGWTTAYRGTQADPSLGGDLSIRGELNLGRRNHLVAGQDFSYVPYLVIGAFASLQPEVETSALPDSGETTGMSQQRSWASTSAIDLDHTWTTRQTTSIGYNYYRRNYLDDFGHDSASHLATTRHAWAFSRTARLEASYRFSDFKFTAAPTTIGDQGAPVSNHALELGGTYTRRLSPSRQIQFSANGGAAYVQTLRSTDRSNFAYWMPTANGMVRLDVGRSWAISADYARTVSVVQGISLQSFATDAASLRVDGMFGPRIEGSLSFAYSNGRVGGAEEPGQFYSYGGIGQFRYALNRWCAASVNYQYYYYRLSDIGGLPTGLPPTNDTNSVRIGVTLWLPFYGSYIDRGGRRPVGGDR